MRAVYFNALSSAGKFPNSPDWDRISRDFASECSIPGDGDALGGFNFFTRRVN